MSDLTKFWRQAKGKITASDERSRIAAGALWTHIRQCPKCGPLVVRVGEFKGLGASAIANGDGCVDGMKLALDAKREFLRLYPEYLPKADT